ncbi:hypothetical protein LINGRAHAP2_LOCUS29337 [Linum grandiflorum]
MKCDFLVIFSKAQSHFESILLFLVIRFHVYLVYLYNTTMCVIKIKTY